MEYSDHRREVISVKETLVSPTKVYEFPKTIDGNIFTNRLYV